MARIGHLIPSGVKPAVYAVVDMALFAMSFLLAYVIRFDGSVPERFLDPGLWVLPAAALFKIAFMTLTGTYRRIWGYSSVVDFADMAKGLVIGQLIFIATLGMFTYFDGFPRSVFVLDTIFALIAVSGLRLSVRAEHKIVPSSRSQSRKNLAAQNERVLIVGAGQRGEKIAREILESRQRSMHVIGFVDDDPTKRSAIVHGKRVLGKSKDLPGIIASKSVTYVIIAATLNGDLRCIVDACANTGVRFKTLPSYGEVIDGSIGVKNLRDVRYEDLLGRRPVNLETDAISDAIKGKTVLVTGAGGSIGSELCRQIIRFDPDRVLLLDASESALYSIESELAHERGWSRYARFLGRVQDKEVLEYLFTNFKPDIVFHAAACKHVPMVEEQPWQAVWNNVRGTETVMRTAHDHRCERFVLVSTDKAVRPANVMGASKRAAELLMHRFKESETRFMAVRFGNVLGSSGSVVPLFQRQIEQGGPVTVTHEDVVRYFMTIPEACQLILQAGVMGTGGEIFVLKMGRPIRIIDMARDLIRLCGKSVDDVGIEVTGLRPGEKLYEELATDGEETVATQHQSVMALRQNDTKPPSEIDLSRLDRAAADLDAEAIKKGFNNIVSEYTPCQEQISS